MARTVKEAKADIFLRDTDSQSLFNNSGVLSFKYYHEWNDCYNPDTGETAQINGEVYDESTNSYKPNCPTGFNPVFNGRLSALWDNLVNCFPEKVESMYQKMRSNGLSYKDMLAKYKEFWRFWCENLYNADAFGYANTNNFTKAYGDKVQVMDYFFEKRQRYMDSKYHCGSSVGNNLRLRLYEKGKGFAIKHYQAIYCTLQWGVGNFSDNRNLKPGTYSYMPFLSESPQDVTFEIDDADLVTELSTFTKSSSGNYVVTGLEGLGDFKFDLNMGLLKRLTKFVMDYTAAKPNTKEQGDNFDMSNMSMLKQAIVRNVTGLKKSIVLSSDLLEEIDFTGTPITGLSTPPTDMLTKLVLPGTIETLNLVGYTNLQPNGFQLAGYSNIDTLQIEDCPNLDSYTICKACYDAGAKLSNVTLHGIDWTVDDVEFLVKLAEKNANLKGKITISDSVKITAAQKSTFIAAWGNIEDKNNSLYISYAIISITAVYIKGNSYLGTKGNHTYKVATRPLAGNDLVAVKWSISENDFATIEEKTGKLSLNKLGSEATDDKATVSADVELSDGRILTATKEVHFYKKSAAIGDYAFANGTYGSDQSESDSTPVGVIFYIDKSKKWALCVGLKNIVNTAWGLWNSTDSNNGMAGIKLGGNSSYQVYDLPLIDNYQNGINVSDGTMRDESNTENGGFKDYGTAINTISDIGFTEITENMYNTKAGDTILGEYFDKAGLAVGDKVARGQLNTIKILAHRDYILQDSKVNLPVPMRTSGQTLWQSLSSCINSVVASHGNQQKYQQYYYPAASYCNAYVPSLDNDAETLDEQFGEGRWFLPSMGEMSRISWYHMKGYDIGAANAIFANAFSDQRFQKPNGGWFWSASEWGELYAWNLYMGSGQVYGYNKYNSYLVRPVAAFRL